MLQPHWVILFSHQRHLLTVSEVERQKGSTGLFLNQKMSFPWSLTLRIWRKEYGPCDRRESIKCLNILFPSFFLCEPFLKYWICYNIASVLCFVVTVLLLFYVLVFWPRGMWDLCSQIRDQTHTPCTGRRSRYHWTSREILKCSLCLVILFFPIFLGEGNSVIIFLFIQWSF